MNLFLLLLSLSAASSQEYIDDSLPDCYVDPTHEDCADEDSHYGPGIDGLIDGIEAECNAAAVKAWEDTGEHWVRYEYWLCWLGF